MLTSKMELATILSCGEKSLKDNYSELAQLVEHTTVNRAVVGSSPTFGVPPFEKTFSRYAERLFATF